MRALAALAPALTRTFALFGASTVIDAAMFAIRTNRRALAITAMRAGSGHATLGLEAALAFMTVAALVAMAALMPMTALVTMRTVGATFVTARTILALLGAMFRTLIMAALRAGFTARLRAAAALLTQMLFTLALSVAV